MPLPTFPFPLSFVFLFRLLYSICVGMVVAIDIEISFHPLVPELPLCFLLLRANLAHSLNPYFFISLRVQISNGRWLFYFSHLCVSLFLSFTLLSDSTAACSVGLFFSVVNFPTHHGWGSLKVERRVYSEESYLDIAIVRCTRYGPSALMKGNLSFRRICCLFYPSPSYPG